MSDKLQSEISFPKENRKVMGNDNPNYQLILNYATTLTAVENALKEANKEIAESKSSASFGGVKILKFDKNFKKAMSTELVELKAEPDTDYDDGFNSAIDLCVDHIKKMDIITLLQ